MIRRLSWVPTVVVFTAVVVPTGAQTASAQTPPTTATTTPPAESSAEYKIRAGDVLSINVWGFKDFTMDSVPVRPDGKISFPTIGEIYVVNQTPAQLSRILTLGIKKYIRDPKVSVTLISSNAERYFVTGSVAHPGSFALTTGTGVREAIASAGDLAPDANDKDATVIREGKTIPVDLSGALNGNASDNIILEPGDTLTINQALITFVGYVNTTGQQPLRRGTTLSKALATAGGPRDGADIERVQIVRKGETIVANLREITADPTKDIPLQPGDLIKIDAADDRTVPVFITGSVGHQGMYRYLPGRRDTLEDAIAWAGGVSGDADLARVKIRRTSESGEPVETAYDLRTVEGRGVRLQANDYIEIPKKRRSTAGNIVTGSLGLFLSLYGLFRRR